MPARFLVSLFFGDGTGVVQGQVGAGDALTGIAGAGEATTVGLAAFAAPTPTAPTLAMTGRLRSRSSSFRAVAVRSLSGYASRNAR